MATFSLPNSNGQIRQSNKGDVYGELWATYNIDLTSSPGKIKVAKRLAPIYAGRLDGNFQTITVFDGYIVAFGNDASDPLTGGHRAYVQAYRNPRLSGSWTKSYSNTFDVDAVSDAVVFAGQLLLSNNTNIALYSDATDGTPDNDWWTTVVSGSALDNGVPHIMDVSRIGAETLFVTDGNLVRYYNTSAGHSTVTLPVQLTACCLATDYKATFVGTYSNSGDAYVYEIYVGEELNGTPVARNAYKIDGTAVLSMDVIDGTVYIVTDRGHIQAFNGIAFITVGSFPFAFDSVSIDGISVGDIEDSNVDRGIHPKGMRAYGKSLYINVNTNNELIDDLASNPIDNDDVFSNVVVNERSPSGVWEFDTETRVLNHRHAITYTTNDNGFHRLKKSAPIFILDNQYTRIITSGRCVDGDTALVCEDPDEIPVGYFITSEIDTNSVQEAWEHLALKIEQLGDNDDLEIKYRTSKVIGYPKYVTGTFLNANTFNTEGDLSMVSAGDEIELIDGTYAGKMAHVVSITQSTSVYSVVLDRDIAVAGETCYARFQNWKKASYENNGQFIKMGTSEVSTWVQFKVVMTGLVELRGLINKGTAKNEL